ncbi:uncharacterized protein K02A2.6 [Trichonephila clavipes]|nr:uncharacterized protein K02A2.6 [Trichonephila clavipes]
MMETVGMVRIFQRSLSDRSVRYTSYIGDGDSKTFSSITASNPYGEDITVSKIECVRHVRKRMGTRLRKLKQMSSKLSDGKSIGGKGRNHGTANCRLTRQNQDLIRALQIRNDSHSHKVTVQFDKFDEENENFDSFIERFETYLDVQNVPIANRAKVFVSSLSAKLYQLLKNLLASDIPSNQTLDKLKDALKKHLTPKPLIIPSRHKFLNGKQTEGEGIRYIAELRALAMNCDYDKDMLNIMLRDVFVSGLRDKMILDRLFEEDNITLEKTLNIALAMEKAFKGTNDIMGRAINSMQTFKKHMDKKSNFTKGRKKTLYCSRCTGTNHAKENCRFISSKCNFCGKIGHIKQACFASKKANAKSVKQKQVTLLNEVEDRNRIPLHELKIQDYILHEEEPKRPPIMINLKFENKSCSMELDTGGASFEFDIIFRKTIEHGNADFLSRLPKTSEELEVKDDITIFQMSQIEALPVTSKELRQETSKDIELGPLLRALREGKDLQGREAQYTIEDGCIMYGQRVCIPRKFRKDVLEELHAGHLGIVKMKAIARSFVYWKNIDNDIEEAAKNCVDCARYKADPPKSKVHYWEYPSMPWERIHVDFAGPIFEHTFFLIVDAHSKWLEVYPMKVTTTKKTIECLRDSFEDCYLGTCQR